MEKRYRIKANIGKDKVLNVNFKQDIDLYEILSLNISKDDFEKLKRNNSYKFFSSDYGVIVGRVLANDAFGVPNAKVSVFIPISDEDKLRTDIKELYPYSFVTDYNRDFIRYNTLPEYSVSDCHTPIGTFPSKRLVLDNNTVLEIYDKYYKYTTITNNAGDYMIFGVPVGKQTIHTDIDLSDIGVLSQIPSDFISKGYTIDMFASPSKFKKSTNLDNLAQVFSENASVNVYPFWGDKNYNEIAITRKDINIQYKFETSCVFIGSVITDSPNNSINHKCEPDVKMGEAGQLVASEGTIEMIRKNVDDVVEEYNINGNKLIDSDGVFCYQIPMNLDFVGTDEYGNIVPTDNPKKGIPTRARVRFRVTLTENGSESLTTHKARYLIPNNPDLLDTSITPKVSNSVFSEDRYYEFGTKTPDACFRDLYWNKVYSVKNYIPRVQRNIYDREQHYLALKGINKKNADGINPLPFNRLNLNVTIPAYKIIDELTRMKDEYDEDEEYNTYFSIKSYWKYLRGLYTPFDMDNVYESIISEEDAIGLDFYNDWLNGCLYFPNWYWYLTKKNDYSIFSRIFEKNKSKYNSELCECKKNDGNADSNQNSLYLVNNCSLVYQNTDLQIKLENYESEDDMIVRKFVNSSTSGSTTINSGIIKRFYNKDNAEIFYYAFGDTKEQIKSTNSNGGGRMGDKRGEASLCTADNLYINKENMPITSEFMCGGKINFFVDENSSNSEIRYVDYVRLFSTDIILLGSLKDNDIHSIPKINYNFPITTSHIPSMGEYKGLVSIPEDYDVYTDTYKSSYNGMNWGSYWFKNGLDVDMSPSGTEAYGVESSYKLGSGLFFGITNVKWDSGIDSWFGRLRRFVELIKKGFPFLISVFDSNFVMVLTDLKTGPNAERISELGVTYDSDYTVEVSSSLCRKFITKQKDGFITSKEIEDNDSRALFASLNSNKLISSSEKLINGYTSYKLCYLYPTSFDGKMSELIKDYTYGEYKDDRSKDYIDFRLGSVFNKKRHFYTVDESKSEYLFPLYDNSFYFYFGLNPGKTAIEKFYSNYMGKCLKEAESLPFSFSISASSTQMCRSEGTIAIKITTPIAVPYTIKLTDSTGKIVSGDTEQYNTEYVFKNLETGKYTVTITDVNLLSVSETASIDSNAVSIDCEVTKSIDCDSTDYSTACDGENYGIITIKSYVLDGNTIEIEELPRPEVGDYVFSFSFEKVTINFEAQSRDLLEDCVCLVGEEDVDGEIVKKWVDGNKIRIRKPGSYVISISENNCDINYNSVTETVTSTKYISMEVNDVDLSLLIDTSNMTTKSLFYDPTITSNDDYTIGNLLGWFGVHDPKTYRSGFNAGNDITGKLKYLFDMSKSIYVESSTENNKLTIETEGKYTLLRSAHPIYDNSSWGYDSDYVTENNISEITCNNNYPNIVSKNYVYGNELNVSGNYEFNKNYKDDDANIYAGNYFACFSNNAEISERANDCFRSETYKPFNKIPLNTDDLYDYSENEVFCTSYKAKKEGISPKIYSRTGMTNPYFRTEFIDRRLDYDLIFITPTKFTVNENDAWNAARLSAETYNGIEMIYTDAKKTIISENEGTEYIYNTTTGDIILGEGKKRFYDSELTIGNNSYSLVDLYYSSLSYPTSGQENIKVVTHDESEFVGDEYKNFGIDNGRVVGYPTTRLLDLDIKEYSDKYVYSITGCSYNIGDVSLDMVAKPGDIVRCELSKFNNIFDVNNLPVISCETISNAEGDIVPLKLGIYLDNEFKAEAVDNGYKYKIVLDDSNHTIYDMLKSKTTDAISYINSDFSNFSDLYIEYGGQIGDNQFIGFLVKKVTQDNSKNLTKRITLVDASSFFEIHRFHCKVERPPIEETITNNARTDIPSTSVSTEGTGTIRIGDETYTVHVTSRGSTNPTEGTAHVEAVKYIITFTNAKVDEIQCSIYANVGGGRLREINGDGTQITGGSDGVFNVVNNNVNVSSIDNLMIYAKCDGIWYNFIVNVNSLNN